MNVTILMNTVAVCSHSGSGIGRWSIQNPKFGFQMFQVTDLEPEICDALRESLRETRCSHGSPKKRH